MLEAIALCEEITGNEFVCKYIEENRRGDHIWWISDLSRFQARYPEWKITFDVPRILTEIYELNVERWREVCVS
jgi:CDP-paratose 2-epimerase